MWRRVSVVFLIIAALLAAARLALHRDDIPYTELEERYSSVSSKFLTLPNGLIVHYRDEGDPDAPVLFLVHGFALSSETWTAWQTELSADYRVIAIDLPGHGLSRVNAETDLTNEGLSDFIAACANELEITSFTLVGSSLGGHAAWLYALNHQDKLDSLVLIGSAGLPTDADASSGRPWALSLVSQSWIKPLLAGGDPGPLVRNGLKSAYADKGFVSPDLVTQYTELVRAPGHRRALMDIANRPVDAAEEDANRLSELTIPVLILQGELDMITPPEHSGRFHNLIPNSELILYEGVGHLPHEEVAADSLKDLRAFLERNES